MRVGALVWICLQTMPVKQNVLKLPRYYNMISVKVTGGKASPDGRRASGRALPDQHPVPVNLPHPVQGNAV